MPSAPPDDLAATTPALAVKPEPALVVIRIGTLGDCSSSSLGSLPSTYPSIALALLAAGGGGFGSSQVGGGVDEVADGGYFRQKRGKKTKKNEDVKVVPNLHVSRTLT